jgi:glycosyltransferase involved in cell wall biosynthesis
MQQVALFLIKSKADLIIALNETLKQELMHRKFPENKIETVGAGINLKAFGLNSDAKKTKDYTAIFLGRLHPAKGIHDVVAIWKNVTVKIPNATLAIIGAGEPKVIHALNQEIEAALLTGKISLLGVLSDNQVYAHMKKAKVFLFTDHESGWGLAVAEAMANGLPVIGYDIGVLKNIYKDGYRVVPLNNTEEFANEVLRLLTNETMRLRLVKLAKQTARGLDWRVATSAFDQALTKHFTPRLL